jgi:hypothetical protein
MNPFYFEHSAKRTALYLKVQEETKKIQLTEQAKKIVGKKLKKACTTRWLSFDHSIEACHADILSILNTLNILGEKDTAVYGLLQRMKGYSFAVQIISLLHSNLSSAPQLVIGYQLSPLICQLYAEVMGICD